ncbi:MAG: hypothetical protein KDD84_14800, partial [Caldilineaceae bacterium]|nr:hypothetical protein [Caldilineaceae bacterium]
MPKDNSPRVQVASRDEWRAWLAANHTQPDGVWLVTFKKHMGDKYVSWDEMVDEALCFGWIDSVKNKYDDHNAVQYFSPRKPGSN